MTEYHYDQREELHAVEKSEKWVVCTRCHGVSTAIVCDQCKGTGAVPASDLLFATPSAGVGAVEARVASAPNARLVEALQLSLTAMETLAARWHIPEENPDAEPDAPFRKLWDAIRATRKALGGSNA